MSITNSKEPILYIVDEMPLTRAQLAQFLSGFARLHSMRIEEVAASTACDDIYPQAQGGMCVINVSGNARDVQWYNIVQQLSQTSRVGPIVLFCDTANADFVRSALHAGARGVVPASTAPAVALKSLDLTLHGGIFVPPSVLDALEYGEPSAAPDEAPWSGPATPDTSSDGSSARASVRAAATVRVQAKASGPKPAVTAAARAEAEAADLEELTPRQMAVLDHLGKARSNKEIARVLDTTEATVKLHVRQVMRKLGAKNRTEAALIAARRDLSPPAVGAAPAEAAAVPRAALPPCAEKPANPAIANERDRPGRAAEVLVAAGRPQVLGNGLGGSVAERLHRLEKSTSFQRPGGSRLS